MRKNSSLWKYFHSYLFKNVTRVHILARLYTKWRSYHSVEHQLQRQKVFSDQNKEHTKRNIGIRSCQKQSMYDANPCTVWREKLICQWPLKSCFGSSPKMESDVSMLEMKIESRRSCFHSFNLMLILVLWKIVLERMPNLVFQFVTWCIFAITGVGVFLRMELDQWQKRKCLVRNVAFDKKNQGSEQWDWRCFTSNRPAAPWRWWFVQFTWTS